MKILDDIVDGFVFLGKVEQDIASALVHNAGKVTTVVNGKEIKVERFGKVQKEVAHGK